MPLIQRSDFQPQGWDRNTYWSTIYPSLFRKVEGVIYERERLELPDGDFVDLDWSRKNSRRLVIVLHGLEGSADRPYIRGIIKVMNEADWDGVALNFRGCSGTPNRLTRGYHSGDTGDLDFLVKQVIASSRYDEIAIVGFSLGGNVTLKYLGERGAKLHPTIKKAVAISTPVDLSTCSIELQKWKNWPYLNSFLKSLKEKIREKTAVLEGLIDLKKAYSAKNFFQYDDAVTAPLHGFESAIDYYTKSSSLPYIPKIKIPTLLINAKNDSFLSEESYPIALARESALFHLEIPDFGGHVGFVSRQLKGYYWTDLRVKKFFNQDF